MKAMLIDAERTAYDPLDIGETMTVGELADVFARISKWHGEDVKVFLRHDGGYTYGALSLEYAEVEEIEEEE